MAEAPADWTSSPVRLLIFRIGYLGDTIIALPAIHAIRAAFPHARLTMLYSRQLNGEKRVQPSEIMPSGLIDDYIAYAGDIAGFRAGLDSVHTAIRIAARRYDGVIYLAPQIRGADQVNRDRRIFRLLGIPVVLGDSPRSPPEATSVHEADFLLRRLAASAINVPATGRGSMDLGITSNEKQAAQAFLREMFPADSLPRLIAVAPTAGQPHKIWPLENFAAVARALSHEGDVVPIFITAPHEKSIAKQLIGMSGHGIALSGQLSLRETGALLQQCALLIGNDTGTVHLAAASGIRCVVVKGTHDPEGVWDPYGGDHCVLRGSDLTPEKVISACRLLLRA